MHTLLGSSWHLSEVVLSNIFYRLTDFMTEPSFKCIKDDSDERDLKALSVVSISTRLFFETLLQNNAKDQWFFGYCTQSTVSSLADGLMPWPSWCSGLQVLHVSSVHCMDSFS